MPRLWRARRGCFVVAVVLVFVIGSVIGFVVAVSTAGFLRSVRDKRAQVLDAWALSPPFSPP